MPTAAAVGVLGWGQFVKDEPVTHANELHKSNLISMRLRVAEWQV